MPVRLRCGDVVLVYISEHGGKQGIGLIKYIGNLQNDHVMKQYVGIELVEPIENGHNGCIDGIQYFSCKESYGIHTLVTNVIRILKPRDTMMKLQEVITIFKNKLSQYMKALEQRDSYISDLKTSRRKLKSHLSDKIQDLLVNKTESEQKIDELDKKVALYQGNKRCLKILQMEELDALEAQLFDSIKNIQETRTELIENKYKCIICVKNQKNVLLGGCMHVVLCEICEQKLRSKICPICRKPYNKINKIKF